MDSLGSSVGSDERFFEGGGNIEYGGEDGRTAVKGSVALCMPGC